MIIKVFAFKRDCNECKFYVFVSGRSYNVNILRWEPSARTPASTSRAWLTSPVHLLPVSKMCAAVRHHLILLLLVSPSAPFLPPPSPLSSVSPSLSVCVVLTMAVRQARMSHLFKFKLQQVEFETTGINGQSSAANCHWSHSVCGHGALLAQSAIGIGGDGSEREWRGSSRRWRSSHFASSRVWSAVTCAHVSHLVQLATRTNARLSSLNESLTRS